ncbi:hypothetical protein TPHA_0E00310 [Tetrapisispora phaffii CBS 4417]|uniref:[Histone H3]-trimethyl-L-lysine(4) demethylase n=1 Tax=Tetrapisispora phaffii (strain ATCC 24235 / CBS 4417 / NBRC 1672 / NRRL Y-8282 / UCD 70-5) TaxID=1071381 RepID=G8BT99_TETPH|nr:hypothetical protein TPHA_0E00310 [Tetrapisispora phaffii CBS 4417]CCE63127.1 hypothetical protein TPHA_0E00310 [Tetrapisispora phaffii CBS 4417]
MEFVPTLYPTTEEFNNPIEYLSQLRVQKIGKRYGMVKLVPPSDFKPPLSINTDTFKFITRLQNLSQLSLVNRNRLFFMKQLNNYNKAMKSMAPILTKPYVLGSQSTDKIYLHDLFVCIYKYFNKTIVSPKEHIMGNKRLWSSVNRSQDNKGAYLLEKIFKKYIFSYYNYLYKMVKEAPKTGLQSLLYNDETPRSLLEEEDAFEEDDFELAETDENLDHDVCSVCSKLVDDISVICTECSNAFHLSCIENTGKDINGTDWFCNNCIVGNGYYGFKEEKEFYSLPSFRKLAGYKAGTTNTELSNKEVEELEDEFWSIVNDSDRNISVKYGADIHNSKPGEITGFPTEEYKRFDVLSNERIDFEEYSKYFNHPMNLVNLPNAKGSLLPLLEQNISGMTIPWIYIGSKFSTFCWHLEDQYTLSANYQQEGFPKVWYSIPEDSNTNLQSYLKDLAPDMFDKQPDLMHQLVTLVSPYSKEFKKANIKCYKVIQRPNEYVITFPKCYHAGFNTGYNFNEAVNFTLDLWLKYGVEAAEDYKETNKMCVFDMNELMFNILLTFINHKKETTKKEQHISVVLARQSYKLALRAFNEASRASDLIYPKVIKTVIELNKPLVTENYKGKRVRESSQQYYIFCSKCKTICFFTFVLHKSQSKGASRKRKKLDLESIVDWNAAAKNNNWELFCLTDYKLHVEKKGDKILNDADFSNGDLLVHIRNSEEISDLLKAADLKLDKIL